MSDDDVMAEIERLRAENGALKQARRSGEEGKVDLTLKRTRPFGNGNVVLWYEPTP